MWMERRFLNPACNRTLIQMPLGVGSAQGFLEMQYLGDGNQK